MKTEYKMLWIDDHHRYVRGDKRELKSLLLSYGIKLIITDINVVAGECPTETEDFLEAINDLELDMVLVDFNMPETGDKIISHIRNTLHHYHLPIIFYTSNDDPSKALQKSIAALNVDDKNGMQISDGIYFCDRDYIYNKAELILKSLLRKEQTIKHSRGLLMSSVCEIDVNLVRCIEKFYSLVPVKKQGKVIQEILKRLKKKYSSAEAVLQEITSNKSDTNATLSELTNKPYEEVFSFIITNPKRFDTFFRASVLREIFRYVDGTEENGDTLSEFYNGKPTSLNALRNDYGHKTLVDLEKEHDDKRCKYIREESRKHLANVTSI